MRKNYFQNVKIADKLKMVMKAGHEGPGSGNDPGG